MFISLWWSGIGRRSACAALPDRSERYPGWVGSPEHLLHCFDPRFPLSFDGT